MGTAKKGKPQVQRHCGIRKPRKSKLFKDVLRTYYMAGSSLHVGETAANETDRVPVLVELMTWSESGRSQLTTADGGRYWGERYRGDRTEMGWGLRVPRSLVMIQMQCQGRGRRAARDRAEGPSRTGWGGP